MEKPFGSTRAAPALPFRPCSLSLPSAPTPVVLLLGVSQCYLSLSFPHFSETGKISNNQMTYEISYFDQFFHNSSLLYKNNKS